MPFLETAFGKWMMTFTMAMVPVLELRGAIPMGIAAGLPPAAACVTAILGNLLPVPLIMLLARRVMDWLRGTAFFGPRIRWLERRAHLKGRIVRQYRLMGLVILVAIPPAGHRGLDRGVGGLGAGYPDAKCRPGDLPGAGHRGNAHHLFDHGSDSLVLTGRKELA